MAHYRRVLHACNEYVKTKQLSYLSYQKDMLQLYKQ